MPVYTHQVEGLIARLRSRATEPGVAMRWKDDFVGAADMLEDIQRFGISKDVPPTAAPQKRPPTNGMNHGPDDINPDTGHPYGEATPAAAERSQSHESTPAPGVPYTRYSVDPATGQLRDPATGQPERRDQVIEGAKLDPATGRPKSAGVVNTTQSMKASADDADPKATKKA